MIQALVLVALAALPGRPRPGRAGSALRCNGQQRLCSQQSSGKILNFLASDGSYQTAGDVCSLFASELAAPSFCLRGDGTATGSLALSAVGSPTTQTMAWCGNGLSCGNVSRQLVSASNYYQTASMAQPSGSFWFCARGITKAPLANQWYVGQLGSWGVQVNANGQAQFSVTGGTTVSSASGIIVGGASQLICGSWHQVAAGSNVATLYVDGAQVGQNSAEPNLASVSASIQLGQVGNNAIDRLGFAMFGTGDPSSTLFARLAAATAPTPQGTRGEALTFSRTSLASCTAPDGSLTWLQPGRPCVSGGLRVRPAVTNLLLDSEQFDAAAWTAKTNITVTANTTVAPDGSQTADTVQSVSPVPIGVNFTSTASTYSLSTYVRTTTGTQAGAIQLFDLSTSAVVCSQNFTATTSWQRVSCSTATLTAAHSVQVQLYPGGTGGAGTVIAWGAQLETGSIASDYCRSESTSATCGADGPPTVAKPATLSLAEGCAKICLQPGWSGANIRGGTQVYLSANGAGNARLFSTGTAVQTIGPSDGTHNQAVSTTFTAGVKDCYLTQWSASGNSLKVTDLGSGASSSTAFTGFPSFGTTLALLGEGSSVLVLPAATISDIQLGSSSGSCN